MPYGAEAQLPLAYKSFDDKSGRVRFEVRFPCSAREALLSMGLSKSAVARLFSQSQVNVAEQAGSVVRSVDMRCELTPGAQVDVLVHRFERAFCPKPCPEPLEVLYEDAFLIGVHKPAPILVHGDGTGAPTLTDMVAEYLGTGLFPAAPQALQRLDVDTTGVVLFSKLPEFQSCFDALIARGQMAKRYLAIVEGAFPSSVTRIDAPMGRDRHDARRMRVVRQGGQEALTHVRFLGYDETKKKSLLSVTLGTGRRHQIRVHLASMGYPIANDPLYGCNPNPPESLMLHATKTVFMHPVTGGRVVVDAGWPERFSAYFAPRDVDSDSSER